MVGLLDLKSIEHLFEDFVAKDLQHLPTLLVVGEALFTDEILGDGEVLAIEGGPLLNRVDTRLGSVYDEGEEVCTSPELSDVRSRVQLDDCLLELIVGLLNVGVLR